MAASGHAHHESGQELQLATIAHLSSLTSGIGAPSVSGSVRIRKPAMTEVTPNTMKGREGLWSCVPSRTMKGAARRVREGRKQDDHTCQSDSAVLVAIINKPVLQSIIKP
jgi:hypothetical protein